MPTFPHLRPVHRTASAALLVAALGAACAPPAPSQQTTPPGWAFGPGQVPSATARGGMVASTDRVASEVGAEILRRGGNATDAAIATFWALAVINPEAGNIGGGGFFLGRTADGAEAALDFREAAPSRATRTMFLDSAGNVTERATIGHLAAGVPGSVAGMWEAHRRFGSRPWAELLAPAIALADGIIMHERLARSLEEYSPRFRRFPATARVFAPGGRAPQVGERWSQPDLAATLRRIAKDGADGFYRGRTAELVEAEMRRGGGLISRADLAAYRARWREPVAFDYRGFRVVSMPPPSSGGATLAELLNVLEGFDLRRAGFGSAAHLHLWTEATRRAFADRNAYLADPDFVPNQPIARMTSDAYAAERRGGIDRRRATPSTGVVAGLGPVPTARTAPREGTHTTHLSVVDGRGNAVAITTTINSLYGNLVTVDGAGFLLNNEMDDFAARPGTANQFGLVQGEANAIAPGKRMLSAMTPTLVVGPDRKLRLVVGSPGGPTIITTVAQVISNVVDFGMSLPDAVGAPRLHHQHLPDELRWERGGLASATAEQLRAMGHTIRELGGFQGDVQAVAVGADGTLTGVADPRRGGAAVGVRERRQVVQ